MRKSLVIVESPAKAKTINKYLGKNFIVKSSVGHIRDLPKSSSQNKKINTKDRAAAINYAKKLSPEEKIIYKKKKAKEQLIIKMGINPNDKWSANYQILPGKEKVVNELKSFAEKSEIIYLATDLDREGEAIAWHLTEAIGKNYEYKRVIFNEITKKAIEAAFEYPQEIDYNRVNSQQTRRFLDRIVGFIISPLLWQKIARGLSAGRVQSVAVKLIVEREKEIRSFIPEEFWEIKSELNAKKQAIFFQVVKYKEKNFRPQSKKEVDEHLKKLKELRYQITKKEDRPTQSKPAAPFITSTLQQAASTRLGFSIKKTMILAQKLYEAGHITYMRTDSFNLSVDAVEMARKYIEKKYGKNYIPPRAIKYTSKKNAQEAHEAIRPSDPTVSQVSIPGMDQDANKLYDLIWRRFLACQMSNAQYISTSLTISHSDYELKSRGRMMKFDGHTKVLAPITKKEDEITLPNVDENEILKLKKLHPSQHFTKSAPRFTEASLVKELEKKGIGRPSTYASIISTIQERGYVALQSKRFYAQKMGEIVTERLNESFKQLMDYEFTAEMEKSLDEIADGKNKWTDFLDKFYLDLQKNVDKASGEQGMRSNAPTDVDISCSECGLDMQIRTGMTGVFLACSGYNKPPKERCKKTINLIIGDEISEDEETESKSLRDKQRCDKCDSTMNAYLLNEKTKLHICGNNPDCDGFSKENGQFKIKGYEGPVIECDKCGADMQLKVGRFGKYFDCSSEECKNTRKLLRNGEAAPPKMDVVPMLELKCEKVDDHYLLRDGAAGLFLAASQFPKNKEIRAPFVDELLPHKNEIDAKYHFLFSAPTVDDDGNRTKVRFARKEKEQYVMTEKEGKATGWRALYRNKKWEIILPKK